MFVFASVLRFLLSLTFTVVMKSQSTTWWPLPVLSWAREEPAGVSQLEGGYAIVALSVL
jgi:hypothetical protein